MFSDPNPDFELGQFGPRHKLVLNKFCVVRPQFVLPTLEFEPQSDGLSENDIQAALEVLSQLGSGYMAIFNGGVGAGASVSHKHLQVVPKASHLKIKPFIDLGSPVGGGE